MKTERMNEGVGAMSVEDMVDEDIIRKNNADCKGKEDETSIGDECSQVWLCYQRMYAREVYCTNRNPCSHNGFEAYQAGGVGG